MTRFWKILPAFSAAVFAALCASAEPWHSPLYLDGGRPHTKRVEIAFENRGGKTLDGKISLVSAKDLGIAGRPAKELRVVGENGRELLFAVVPDSETLSENSELAIPVACVPNGKTRAWVYFDNPAAWELPSNLGASAVSAAADAEEKIDFESGGKFPPQNWSDNSQKTYRNELAAAGGRGGGKCASTVAEKGSKPQWVCISREFPAEAGDKFKFSGWVRGENVKGKAGFYIHVGPKNIHKDQNSGTFDWKKIEFEGVVPEGVKSVSFGTVLYASEGRAFFDDLYVKIEKSRKSQPAAAVVKTESLELSASGEDAKWHLPEEKYPSRIKIGVPNFSDSPKKNALAAIPINRITNANYGKEAFAAVSDGKETPFFLASGYVIASVGEIAPRSEKTVYIYLDKDRKNQKPEARAKLASGILSDYDAELSASADAKTFGQIMDSPANLLKNPSFESGAKNWGISNASGPEKIVDGGLYGKRAAMLDMEGRQGEWRGFRQSVPASAGSEYIVAGWVKMSGGKAGAVHAHFSPKGAKFNAYSSPVHGDEWKMFAMSVPARSDGDLEVHLTATSGKYLYDGIIVAECVRANMKGIENASDGGNGGRLSVWQTDNIVKIFPSDAPGPEAEPYLELAGNEEEGMQLGIRGNSEIKNLEVSADAPVYAGSLPLWSRVKTLLGMEEPPCLPAPQIGNIGNVAIDTQSRYFHFTDLKPYERFVPSDNFGVMYPDPIIPSPKFDLPANFTKGVYLTFRAPKGAKPGVYEGQIRLSADGKVLKTLPYKIRVYGFSLSDEPQVYAIFDIRLSSGAKYKNYTHREAAKYLKSKKLSSDTVPARISFKLENGKPVADFKKFDEEAEYYLNELKFPYLYLPFRAGTFGWARPPAPYLGENPYPGEWPYNSADHSALNPKYREYLVESLRQIAAHLEEKGWTDRFMFYISDEPFAAREDIEKQMIALCDAVHEGAPKMKIYCSTWRYVPQWVGKLDIWGVGAQGQASEDEIALLKKGGAEIITTTDGQFVLDNPYNALERLLPLYCYKYGFKGYEFWGADWYTLNPLKWGIHLDIPQSDTPGKHYRVRYPNGDGYIFYPGKLIGQKEPFASVRMESHRDGVEDYEYFVLLEKLAKQKGDKAALDALERIKKMAFIPNAGGRNAPMLLPNPEEYTKLRREIARHIERLKSDKQ